MNQNVQYFLRHGADNGAALQLNSSPTAMEFNVVEDSSQFYTVIIPCNYRLRVPFPMLKVGRRSPTDNFRIDVPSWPP